MDLLPLAALMLATGLIGGVLAGLLGIGGGIVIVPVMEYALGLLGVDAAVRMHIAVATSLATIAPTSISSARAHHKRGAVDFPLVKSWGPAVVLGAIAGGWLAARVSGDILAFIFVFVALLMALKMLLPLEAYRLGETVPRRGPGLILPAVIGLLSAMMGIGGGVMSVSVMSLFGQPIHKAVGTASLFGLCIALPAVVTYMLSGYGDPRLPVGSIGYVNLVGFAMIGSMTLLAAPFGARIAHALSRRHLSVMFGGFLLMVAGRMLYKALMA